VNITQYGSVQNYDVAILHLDDVFLEVFRGNKMPAQREIPFRPWQVCPAVGYTDKALCNTRTAWFLNAEAAV